MTNDDVHRVVTLDDLRNKLQIVTYNSRNYFVPVDELNKVLKGDVPIYALNVQPCNRAGECYSGNGSPCDCDNQQKCFKGFEIRDTKTLQGIAEALRRDSRQSRERTHRQRASLFIGTRRNIGHHRCYYLEDVRFYEQPPESD